MAENDIGPHIPGDEYDADGNRYRAGKLVPYREVLTENTFGQIVVRDHLSPTHRQDFTTFDHNRDRTNGVEANAIMTLPVIENVNTGEPEIVLIEFRPYGLGGAQPTLEAPGNIINRGETPIDTLHRTLAQRGITYGETVYDQGNMTETTGRLRNVTAATEGSVTSIDYSQGYADGGRKIVSLRAADHIARNPDDPRITNGLTRALIGEAARARGIPIAPRVPMSRQR